ncbi:MAG TPA: hypothetical protein VKP67_28805 [Xanthobacteraceae bacterium]|nr:hypothetical protein [Xanthobacteraceae bacterium]
MSRVRFATARALFETFPKSVTNIAAAPTDDPPVTFLHKLVEAQKFEDAVTFCAYLLPRREAVWWACGCARTLLGDIAQNRAACLLMAEAWVYEPDDQHRQAALELGMQADSNDPLTWLALAAGWSGGMLSSHPQMPAPVPPYMTARAARIAVQLSAHFAKKKNELPAYLQACIAEGIKLAENGL